MWGWVCGGPPTTHVVDLYDSGQLTIPPATDTKSIPSQDRAHSPRATFGHALEVRGLGTHLAGCIYLATHSCFTGKGDIIFTDGNPLSRETCFPPVDVPYLLNTPTMFCCFFSFRSTGPVNQHPLSLFTLFEFFCFSTTFEPGLANHCTFLRAASALI